MCLQYFSPPYRRQILSHFYSATLCWCGICRFLAYLLLRMRESAWITTLSIDMTRGKLSFGRERQIDAL